MARLLSSSPSSSGALTRTTTTTSRCLLAAAVVALSLAVGQASAQDDDDPNHGVVFLYPATKDLILNLMDTVNVTYTSPFPTPNLYAFCDGGSRQVSMNRAPSYNATVPYLLNFTSATPCWFNLRPGTEAGHGANTQSFTIIGQERASGSRVFGVESDSSSSSSSSSTSSSSTTGTGTGSSSTGQSQSTGTSSNSNSGSSSAAETGQPSSLSGAASAGVGVGVAILVIAIAAGVFAWWWRRRRRNTMAIGGNSFPGAGGAVPPQAMQPEKQPYYNYNVPSLSSSSPHPSSAVPGYSPGLFHDEGGMQKISPSPQQPQPMTAVYGELPANNYAAAEVPADPGRPKYEMAG